MRIEAIDVILALTLLASYFLFNPNPSPTDNNANKEGYVLSINPFANDEAGTTDRYYSGIINDTFYVNSTSEYIVINVS